MGTRRIELTVKTDYVPGWGLTEGLREFLQNARDSEIEFSAPMEILHKGNTLTIKNQGCKLPLESLLLGHTTKADRADLAGQYGEGQKLACLALARAGHRVTIRTGGEVWTASIEESQVFKCPVLVFTIRDGNKDLNRVSVEIDNISADQWARTKPRFLFLQKDVGPHFQVDVYNKILLDPVFKGMLFVKGIFVAEDPRLTYGYDFYYAQVDRDRKMIDPYNQEHYIKNLWESATWDQGAAKLANEIFWEMLEKDARDLSAYDNQYCVAAAPAWLLREIKNRFILKYGENAAPASSPAEQQQVEHFGKYGVILPKRQTELLWKAFGGKEKAQKEYETSVVRVYGSSDLTNAERLAYRLALTLVNHAAPVNPNDIEVVDFKADSLFGIFQSGKIKIARKTLARPESAVRILIHEIAHWHGDDGSKGHVQTLEEMWEKVAGQLMLAGIPERTES